MPAWRKLALVGDMNEAVRTLALETIDGPKPVCFPSALYGNDAGRWLAVQCRDVQ